MSVQIQYSGKSFYTQFNTDLTTRQISYLVIQSLDLSSEAQWQLSTAAL